MKVQNVNLHFNSLAPLNKGERVTPPHAIKSYPQMDKLSNVYYTSNIHFGRSKKEHESWGARVNPVTKAVTFKISTYHDTKNVTVNVFDSADKNCEQAKRRYALRRDDSGVFSTVDPIPASEIKPGDKYNFMIEKGNGDIDTVKDPYAFRQESLLGASTIYDHSAYQWKHDKQWLTSPERISRLADPAKNNFKSFAEASIYEFNTATFTKNGNFSSAKPKLKYVKDMGFNTIHIMPVENTNSFNWGYDGVDKLAPSEHLGGPDKLKGFIDEAHKLELNVVMDMVPNHLGPDGAQLARTGPYIKGPNDFGEGFNLEGENSRYTRDYIVNAALNWLENYHCDGLRLDMTKYMESDRTLAMIAAEINHHYPDAFIIAEDGRGGVDVDGGDNIYSNPEKIYDYRVARPLKEEVAATGYDEEHHVNIINSFDHNSIPLSRLGMDSEWAFPFFHNLKGILYGSKDFKGLEEVALCSQNRVKYVMSHDEIGNFEGTRLVQKLMVPKLNLDQHVIWTDEDITRKQEYCKLKKDKGVTEDEAGRIVNAQKAQLAAQGLAQMLQEGKLEKYKDQGYSQEFFMEVLEPLGIQNCHHINYKTIKTAFDNSIAQHKMALAFTYSIPGPKMVFQGDEKADLTPFRFFRKFEYMPYEDYLYVEKGYQPGEAAFKESKMGSIKYSQNGKNLMDKHGSLVKDLNKINSSNSAMAKGYMVTDSTVKHPISNVFATHSKSKEGKQEIFAITNFGNENFPKPGEMPYEIVFPQGKWKQVINTDSAKYGGSGRYENNETINANGSHKIGINLAKYSSIIFERVSE